MPSMSTTGSSMRTLWNTCASGRKSCSWRRKKEMQEEKLQIPPLTCCADCGTLPSFPHCTVHAAVTRSGQEHSRSAPALLGSTCRGCRPRRSQLMDRPRCAPQPLFELSPHAPALTPHRQLCALGAAAVPPWPPHLTAAMGTHTKLYVTCVNMHSTAATTNRTAFREIQSFTVRERFHPCHTSRGLDGPGALLAPLR